MEKATTIGLDIAKQVFQVHGADKAERPVLRRKLRRSEVIRFFSDQSPCLVGIEASGSAHHRARVLSGLGHTVRLMAPQFVKPYVKPQKNDTNDAEAICEAVTRSNMRFVSSEIRRTAGPAVHAPCPQPAGWLRIRPSSSTRSAVCWPSMGSYCRSIQGRCAAAYRRCRKTRRTS